jgi:hypothetical protein
MEHFVPSFEIHHYSDCGLLERVTLVADAAGPQRLYHKSRLSVSSTDGLPSLAVFCAVNAD